jgi:hypothetical protein
MVGRLAYSVFSLVPAPIPNTLRGSVAAHPPFLAMLANAKALFH